MIINSNNEKSDPLLLSFEANRIIVVMSSLFYALIMGSFPALLIIFLLGVFFEDFLNALNYLTLFLIYSLSTILVLLNQHSRVLKIQITKNQFLLKTFLTKPIIIQRNKLERVKFLRNKIQFIDNSKKTNLKTDNLPLKTQIQINHIFAEWAYQEKADLENLNQQRQSLKANPPKQSKASLRDWQSKLYRGIILILTLSLIILAVWFMVDKTFFNRYMFVLYLAGFSPFLIFFFWTMSINRVLKIDSEGIHYHFGHDKVCFKWREIEVILLRTSVTDILVWQKHSNQRNRISYFPLSKKETRNCINAVKTYAFIYDIPTATL